MSQSKSSSKKKSNSKPTSAKKKNKTGKNILVLSASPRKNGNSNTLCDQFIQGAHESGHKTEKIRVHKMKIKSCCGCNACQKKGVCVYKDDMPGILKKMIDADVIVLATPVYFYSMNGQLKTLIDRTYARYKEIKNKEFYFIMTGGASEESSMDSTLVGLRSFIQCLPGSEEKGVVYGAGLGKRSNAKNTPAYDEALTMGKTS